MEATEISIVTTVYKSEAFLKEFYQRSMESIKDCGFRSHEFVFVIDGITDNSIAVLQELKLEDPHIRIVQLSRNFGHHKAMMTGIGCARGDLVFAIDCDLEEKPELVIAFYAKYQDIDADVIFGVQDVRKGKFFEKVTGKIFYWIFNKLADTPIEPNILMARLMSRRYVDQLEKYTERSLFLGGVFALVGFNQVSITVQKGSRGATNYSIKKRAMLMVDAITSSTHRLLVYVFYLGIFISSMSFVISLFYLINAIFIKDYLGGWPSLILSIWFLSGIIILCLGIVGMYISKMFEEVKQRPLAVIQQEL